MKPLFASLTLYVITYSPYQFLSSFILSLIFSFNLFFMRLASASSLVVAEAFNENDISADNAVQIVTDSASIFLPLSDIIDFEKEKIRLEGEKAKVEGEIERIEKKLSNEGFVSKAPAAVVEGEKAKMAKYRETLDGIISALNALPR